MITISRKIVWGAFFVLALLLTSKTSYAVRMQNILVLHSYDAAYGWTVDLQHGIEDAVKSASLPLKMSVEYLDTKRINTPAYYQNMQEYIKYKYSSYEFDGVIITDDNALTFFNSLKLDNLKNLPTVAVGINSIDSHLYASTENGTIIHESDYISENLRLIKKLRPKIKNIYFLSDYGVTSKITRKKVLSEMMKYSNINLVEIRDQTLKQASKTLSKISPDDAVILTHFNTEVNVGNYYGYDEVATTISTKSAAPVFVFWEFYIKGDVLGGYVNRSHKMGIQAVELLGEKLPQPVEVDLVIEKDHAAVFSYHSLNKHNIAISELPNGAHVLGKPPSFIEQNFRVLSISFVLFTILMSIILTLTLLLKRKREMSHQKQQMIVLQDQHLKEQRDFVYLLSDAIETHSGGDGNHAIRVSKLAALLARHAGLSSHEQLVIERLTPMHDVGKVGIPAHVLTKPDVLTSEERKIIEEHPKIGHQLLSKGEGDSLELAAIIALEHHEYWNGQGYPDQKIGDEAHIYSRITAVVDVFDSLLSHRSYRDAWTITEVIAYFEEQSGEQFDPELSNLLLNNVNEFIRVRERYS